MYQPPNEAPPQQQQQGYYPPPPAMNQQQQRQKYPDPAHVEYGNSQYQDHSPPTYGTPPPMQPNEVGIEGGGEKIRPAKHWNDIWATVLWLLNLGAFIGLAVVAIRTYRSHTNTYNGVQSENQVPGITFDTSTFKIFGFAGIVGFGISFLYLILANLFPRPLIIVTFIGSIIVYFGVTIFYFVKHYYSAAIVFLIFSCLYVLCFFWWKSRIPFATGKYIISIVFYLMDYIHSDVANNYKYYTKAP